MTSNRPPSDADAQDEHDEVAALLPWYVNGTLDAEERAKVGRHVEDCPACRQELAALRALADRIAAAPVPRRSPEAAYARLRDTLAQREAAPRAPARRGRAGRRSAAVRWVIAAMVLLLLAPWGWRQLARLAEPSFRTLSGRTPAGEPGDVRVVFDRSMQPARIDALLEAVGGRRVGEPGPGGVYTIRLSGPAAGKPDLEAALAYLRAQEGVLLAEPVKRD